MVLGEDEFEYRQIRVLFLRMYLFALSLTTCNPSLSFSVLLCKLATIAWNQLVIPVGLNGHKGKRFEDKKVLGGESLAKADLVALGIWRY